MATKPKPKQKKPRKKSDPNNTRAYLSKEKFFAILRENSGIYTRTANAIREIYHINMTRQAVFQRAQTDLEQLEDIHQENLDVAESGLQFLMRSKNQQIRLKAIELFLKSKGKSRGYFEKHEIEAVVKKDLSEYSTEELERRALALRDLE